MFPMTEQEYSQIVARNLRRLAYEKDKTQQDIAKSIGVGRSTVACWLNGIRTPKMDKVDALCRFFDCSREDIMEEYDPARKRAYYLDPDTARKAQKLKDSPGMRMLFDAVEECSEADLEMMAGLAARLKGTNPDA